MISGGPGEVIDVETTPSSMFYDDEGGAGDYHQPTINTLIFFITNGRCS